MKVGMKTNYIIEEELAFALTVTIYHDGEFDIEEVKQKIVNALEKKRLECQIKEIEPDINAFDIKTNTNVEQNKRQSD